MISTFAISASEATVISISEYPLAISGAEIVTSNVLIGSSIALIEVSGERSTELSLTRLTTDVDTRLPEAFSVISLSVTSEDLVHAHRNKERPTSPIRNPFTTPQYKFF